MGMRDGSRGYYDAENDRILVRFSNGFTMKMMSEESKKATLCAMLTAREGKLFGTDRVVYELIDKNELEKDDLLDTLEE